MLNKKQTIFYLLLLQAATSQACAIELEKGAVSDRGKTPRTEAQKAASPIITRVVKSQSAVDTGLSVGHTNLSSGDTWYRLYKNNSIYAVDVSTEKLVNTWPLAAKNPCEEADTPDCETPWWVGRWGEQELIEPEVQERFELNHTPDFSWGISAPLRHPGCFENHPLRYGDINQDSQPELALFLNGSLIVFNPTLGKTSFVSLYNLDDWRSKEETLDQYLSTEVDGRPQYVSNIVSSTAVESISTATINEPGYRAYAKHYMGDYDTNGKHDILIWRKLYQSNRYGQADGFSKLSDLYAHYELVNGEYIKKDTPAATIQSWLVAKSLTWQKGYPSKSECAGQQDQLIPEMHDPLLNDPDVLK